MTTTASPAEPDSPAAHNLEVVTVRHLQRGVVVIEGDSRSMIHTLQKFGQMSLTITHVWFTNNKHRRFDSLDTPVTVLAESLPATYWIAKYELLQDHLVVLIQQLTHRGQQAGEDHTEAPAARAARAIEASHAAAEVQRVLDAS